MSLNDRLSRLEAALHQTPNLPVFSVWRCEGDELVNVQTGERLPASAVDDAEVFTLTIRPPEGHDVA